MGIIGKIVGPARMAAVLTVLATAGTAVGQEPEKGRLTFSNRLTENWEVTAGIQRLSFYNYGKDAPKVKGGLMGSDRSSFSASLAIGKWFSPEIGLRTKAGGYWGKRLASDDPKANGVKFITLQEQVMVNVTNVAGGFRNDRKWDVLAYAGGGLARIMTDKDNSLSVSAGAIGRLRLGEHVAGHAELGYSFGGNKPAVPGALKHRRYQWLTGEIGVTFTLGRNTWRKGTVGSGVPVYSYEAYRSLTADSEIPANTTVIRVADEYAPFGMVLIERGHLTMGGGYGDDELGAQTPTRDISVDDFWMDRTEVTNKQYRRFVDYVVDSVAREMAASTEYLNNREAAKESLYLKNPVTGERTLDPSKVLYRYEVYDYSRAAMTRNRLDIEANLDGSVMISKDTAYVREDGTVVRETIERPLSGAWDFLNTYIVSVVPDQTCWVNDFPNAENETYLRYYWNRTEYDDYPVVGVTWEQANAYCAWRTDMAAQQLGEKGKDLQRFRLPTEAEWEYAARGKFQNEFPWAGEFRGKGVYFANYMSDEGDLTKDGNIITARVGVYPPNTNGLYDMAGNVAEWTSTVYTEEGVEAMNVMNPQLSYNAAPEDDASLKRKTVKGGSWKDPESHVRSAWRTWEYQGQARSYIGFRCVRSLETTVSGRAVITGEEARKVK